MSHNPNNPKHIKWRAKEKAKAVKENNVNKLRELEGLFPLWLVSNTDDFFQHYYKVHSYSSNSTDMFGKEWGEIRITIWVLKPEFINTLRVVQEVVSKTLPL